MSDVPNLSSIVNMLSAIAEECRQVGENANIAILDKKEAKAAVAEENENPVVVRATVECPYARNPANKVIVVSRFATHNKRNGGMGLREIDTKLVPNTFGFCEKLQKVCKPVISGGKWKGCNSTNLIDGMKSVTMSSYMICSDGKAMITLVTDGQEKNKNEVIEENCLGEKIGTPINGWLQLYDGVTVDEEGREVSMPNGIQPEKWSMREDRSSINRYAIEEIEGKNKVITGEKGELIDSEGRYWVAVGPKVMNSNHKDNEICTADEMNYGTKIDVVICDTEGIQYYIPCVVGDCKAHTYPNGIYQTGNAFPNGEDSHPENNDGSVIEFCGKGSISGLDEYNIDKIIVYDVE